MATLVFSPPSRNTPGFLRRNIKALELQKALNRDPSPENLMAMAEFLAQFIEGDDPVESLLDASQADFESMVAAIGGETDPNSQASGANLPAR